MEVLRRRFVVINDDPALRRALIDVLLQDPTEAARISEHGENIYNIDYLVDRALAVLKYTLIAEITAKTEENTTYIVRHYTRAEYTRENRELPDEAFLITRIIQDEKRRQTAITYYLPIYWR